MSLAALKLLEPDTTPALHVLPKPEPGSVAVAAPAPSPKKAAGLNLGALASAKPKKAAGTERPTIAAADEEADKELKELVTKFAEEQPRLKALEGSVDITRAEITARAFPLWLAEAGRKPDLSSVHVFGTAPTTKILFGIQNRYPSAVDFGAGQEAVIEAIARPGENPEATLARFEEHFEPGLMIALNFTKVPEEKRQALVDALLPIFQEHDLLTVPEGSEEGEASPAVVCKQTLRPKPSFHVARHTAFTIAENLRLQEILPAVAMVKVTGLKDGTK